MSSFRRWSIHPPKTTSSPEQEAQAFSSPAEDGVGRTAGRNVADGRPNEDAAFISVSFFVVLLALPIVSVFFMCARYACERAALGREARRARARARAALRTQFAPSPLDATTADGNDVGENEDREARGTFAARGNNTVRAVVNASTIDRLADAVIAGANPGYRRISRRRRRRIFQNENSIASYRREAVRRDLRRAFRTGDFSNYDRNLLHRVLQEQLDGNDNIEGIEGEYDEETTNFRIPAASIMLHDGSEGEDDGVAANNAFFVSEEPGPASRKTLQSLPSCKIGDKNWQLFTAGRTQDDLQNLTTCALCLENLQPNQSVIVLECEHVFCKSCVLPWFRLKASCPTCRRVVFAYSKEDRETVFSLPTPTGGDRDEENPSEARSNERSSSALDADDDGRVALPA